MSEVCCRRLAEKTKNRHFGNIAQLPGCIFATKACIDSRKKIVIIRPHRSTMCVDAAYCYRPSSVVCQSACLFVCRSVGL